LLVRFGLFEADLETGELRKQGMKIRLQDQPFEILAILLRSPGQIVTREELRQTLWGTDTFVDFDRSLNKAINRLREALEDSAENPRFIETIPKRGYRFIAPVEPTQAAAMSSAVTNRTLMSVAFDPKTGSAGQARVVFQTRIVGPNLISVQYDVAPDGRFLINSFPSGNSSPLTMITGWQLAR